MSDETPKEEAPQEGETKEAEQAPGIVDKAAKIVVELDAKLKEYNEVASRLEKVQALQIVSGQTEAGSAPPEKKEETPQEYAKRVLANDPTLKTTY